MTETIETTTLGGGCFWCLEAIFIELIGVTNVVSGYSGGSVQNPSYKQVCTGTTGHAEVVQITFNPAELSFADLLRIFFTIHNPTTLNRQGNDIGTQYRSGIFFHSAAQEKTARKIIREIQAARIWENEIVTEVTELQNFYPAEDYHQDYFVNNPNQPYCRAIVSPKVHKFRKKFADRLKQ